MQMGMIGLGRMGSAMVRRLMRAGHDCVVYDHSADAVRTLSGDGATGCESLTAFVRSLDPPRTIWLMVPAGAVDAALDDLVPQLAAGDVVIDGGNSHYQDDIRRAKRLAEVGLHYLDVGTSGGVHGLERGFCQMIGGESEVVQRLDPIFAALAPGIGAAPRTPGRGPDSGTAEQGYLHCGPNGAGHFVKMVHNGIEYGLMAAYAEGLDVLRHAGIGDAEHTVDAETSPVREPEYYRYHFDLGEVAEVWRRGSVISSWLLDLTAAALHQDGDLNCFSERVSDSGEGRWTIQAAVDTGVPAPVLSAALYERFASRGEAAFANRVLSAMRHGFGGHPAGGSEDREPGAGSPKPE